MSKRTKRFLVAIAAIIVFAALPILSLVIAAVIAGVLGCDLDEGSIHACLVLGLDLGGLLYFMGVAGWMAMFTVPIAALALAILALIWITVALAGHVKQVDGPRPRS